MPTEDFVKYITKAKGIFLSKYNTPISNIQVIEDNRGYIKFLIESPSNGGTKKRVIVKVRKEMR